MNKRSFYVMLTAISLLSYGWLFFSMQLQVSAIEFSGICIFKNISAIPCPACGTTRSVLSIIDGDMSQAFSHNALGFLATCILIIAPFWLAYDYVFKKATLFATYQIMEGKLKNKNIAFPLIALMLANWLWNIIRTI